MEIQQEKRQGNRPDQAEKSEGRTGPGNHVA